MRVKLQSADRRTSSSVLRVQSVRRETTSQRVSFIPAAFALPSCNPELLTVDTSDHKQSNCSIPNRHSHQRLTLHTVVPPIHQNQPTDP
jgi:hypothetical protein